MKEKCIAALTIDGRSPSYIINRIRMFVCLSVCPQTPPREIDRYSYVIYGSTQNLSGKDYFVVSSRSDHRFGRYCPKTGHRSKKWHEKRFFLTVFRVIRGVSLMILT
mgnify:CR=1 FL=1